MLNRATRPDLADTMPSLRRGVRLRPPPPPPPRLLRRVNRDAWILIIARDRGSRRMIDLVAAIKNGTRVGGGGNLYRPTACISDDGFGRAYRIGNNLVRDYLALIERVVEISEATV